jgi:hypothetical protein
MINNKEIENGQAASIPLAQIMKEPSPDGGGGREALYEVVEEAVRQLCGALHHPEPQAEYRRAGSANSTASLGGRREALKRPRGCKQSGRGQRGGESR